MVDVSIGFRVDPMVMSVSVVRRSMYGSRSSGRKSMSTSGALCSAIGAAATQWRRGCVVGANPEAPLERRWLRELRHREDRSDLFHYRCDLAAQTRRTWRAGEVPS